MISAATGAMALVMTTLVKEHGLQYLLQQHFNWCHSNMAGYLNSLSSCALSLNLW
jgi:hypothetical protein